MSLRHRSLLVALATVGPVGACSDQGPAEVPICKRSEAVIRVTSGTAPKITWTPDCRAAALFVFDADTVSAPPPPLEPGAVYWTLLSRERPGHPTPVRLRSGIRYGVVPQGAAETKPAIPLEPGRRYALVLLAHDESGSSHPAGILYFNP